MSDSPGAAAWPLLEAQEGLWYAQRLDPGNPAFNTGHYLDLQGPLDVAAFHAAVDAAAAEADGLSLRFRAAGGTIVQCVDPALQPLLDVVDLSGEPGAEAAALAAMAEDMARPLDPAKDGLAAHRLFRLGADRHLWFTRAHHLVLDGFGADLLIRRVAALYAAANRDAPGPALAPFAAAVAADGAYRTSARRAGDAAYWWQLMAEAPEASGPGGAAIPRAARFSRRTGTALPAGDALRRVSAELEVGWPDLLTALLAVYWRRVCAVPEAVVGVTFMNRFGSAAARVPATLMNVLPLRVAADESLPLGEALRPVLDQLARLRRHGRFRGEQLRRDLGRVGRPLHGAIVNIQPFHDLPAFPGLTTELHILGTGPVDGLTFDVRTAPGASRMTLLVEANPELCTQEETDAHAVRAAAFVCAVLEAGSLRCVPTATAAEIRALVHDNNDTCHPVPDTTLAVLIAAAMRARPDATALLAGETALSYGELDRRSAALAALLAERGIGPGDLVAVSLDRSPELIVGLLGILRAGAAYLPLDPAHPADRLNRILRAAAPRLVLAPAPLPEPVAVLPPSAWPEHGTVPPGPAPGDLAYVIYTSGSTGEPKGVAVEHRAVVNRLLWMREQYGFTAADRILQKTPVTFDVSVWELFLPFLCGGTMVLMPPEAHRDPGAIAALVRGAGVTTAHFVPSMLGAFLGHPGARGLRLRRTFCSGEELTAGLRDRFHEAVRGELHNLYGPTEAAVDVSFWDASAVDRSRPVPIGRPVWNTGLYVLDEFDRPVPPGVTGQLCIAGVQLARGYLNRPDLTAASFVPDPFHPGARMYRTGDLARFRADGAVVYGGRMDGQVKLRGFRIELGEVEAAALSCAGVRDVRVVARDAAGGDRRLVAYVVPGPDFDPAVLRAHLLARLPEYMVPSATVTLRALPVNGSGKLDRTALPAPSGAAPRGRPPATGTERRLAALFAEVLGVAEVGAEDDFFDRGGHSILAVELMLHIHQAFGRDPGLGALFEHPTVARLATLLDSAAVPPVDDGLRPVLPLAAGTPGTAPLFAVHPAGGIAWCYGPLARALGPERPVFGLQSPAIDPGVAPPHSLDALAALYADHVLATTGGTGPVHLAGWSVGGIIAHAVAVQLRARRVPVGAVALLDAYPADAWRAEPEPSPEAVLRALLVIAGHDPDGFPGLLTRDAVLAFLRRGGTPLGRLPDAALDGVVRVVEGNNRLVRHHRHGWFDGTLTLLRAARDDHGGRALSAALWRPYAARVEAVDVPVRHGEMVGPDATAAIAPRLRALMGDGTAADGPAPRRVRSGSG